MYNIGERWMFRNPSVEVKGSIRVSTSLFDGCPDHTHPSGKVGWSKLEDVKHHRLLVRSGHIKVVLGKTRQSVGSQDLG